MTTTYGRRRTGTATAVWWQSLAATAAALLLATAPMRPAAAQAPNAPAPGDLRSLRPAPGQPMSDRDIFVALDVNGDGSVDPAEWRERKMVIFYLLDRDGDLYLVPAEMPGLAPADFAAADLDGDGRLSGYEFNQARITQFAMADADGNDIVTLVELHGYRERLAGR